MLVLKEFADFVNLNLANLAPTYAQILADSHEGYRDLPLESRLDSGRRLLKAVTEACRAETAEPLSQFFTEAHSTGLRRWPPNIVPASPLAEVEALGDTLTPVVPNLEAGKFLWQLLTDVRRMVISATSTLPPVQDQSPALLLSDPEKNDIAVNIEEHIPVKNLFDKNAEHLHLLLDASPDPVAMYDAAGQVTYLNPAFVQTFGWSHHDLLSQHPEFIPKDSESEAEIALAQLLQQGKFSGFETERLTKKGQRLHVQQSGAVLRDLDGKIAGHIIYSRDVTNNRQAEQDLLSALTETQSLYDAICQLSVAQSYDELLAIIREYTSASQAESVSIGYFNPAVALSDPMPPAFEILASWPPKFDHVFKGHYQLAKLPSIDQVIRSELTVCEDIRQETFVADALRAVYEAIGAVTVLYAPLTVAGQWLGFLTVLFQKRMDFTEADLQRISALARQLSVAVQNIHNFEQTKRRATQLETVARISMAASKMLDAERLLDETVHLIRDEFGFYYVGLFLVDSTRTWAVLQAGTGEAGQIQLDRNHRLKIGGESMVGWSVQNRRARLALDVGEEAVHFQNPDLPDTHSEMALPLISRGDIIGALSVQSVEQNAFSDEDIISLQTMADQIANAIGNARLFEQSQRRARREQTIREISEKMQAATSLEQLVKTTTEELAQRFSADYALVELGIDTAAGAGQHDMGRR